MEPVHSTGCTDPGRRQGGDVWLARYAVRLASPPIRASRPMTRQMLSPQPATWLSWLLLLLGVGGFAAVWVIVGLYSDAQSSWMAVLGALDAALMLRLGHWPAGPRRATMGVAATLAMMLLANWGITSGQLGAVLGLQPWDSALKLGLNHAWTLAQLANGAGDALWLAVALVVAALTAR